MTGNRTYAIEMSGRPTPRLEKRGPRDDVLSIGQSVGRYRGNNLSNQVQPIRLRDLNRPKLTPILQGVSRCPFCSKSDPTLSQVWEAGTSGTPRADGALSQRWAAYRCASCGSIITACGAPGDNIGLVSLPYVFEVYPAPPEVSDAIPAQAKRFLEQALETLHAPDAAAVMAGSAVDGMLKHLGYQDGSLYSRIDKARDDAILTQRMADWAHSVRLGSNRPRHADADRPNVTPEEAKRSVRFAQALGDFLFVLSAQIEDAVRHAND